MMPVEVCLWTKASWPESNTLQMLCARHARACARAIASRGPSAWREAAPSAWREAIVSLMSTCAALLHQDVAARPSHASLPLRCVSAAPIARLIGRRALRSRHRTCSRT